MYSIASMSNPLPALTDRQLKTYEVLARVRMAWIALYFALGLFLTAFFVFVLALFLGKNAIATSIVGLIDGILGWVLRTVYSYLFPSGQKAASGKPK